MQRTPLHIISFDNPFPPVYGGVIDVWYKIKALNLVGFDIFLHCFVDEIPSDQTVPFTSKTWFYKRNKSLLKLFSPTPFAVATRCHANLAKNVKSVQAPVLFEGFQSTCLLRHMNLGRDHIFLRLHNLEANYFLGQFKSETNFIRKIAYLSEFFKYRPYQSIAAKFQRVFTLSVAETAFIDKHSGNAVYVPVFHGNQSVKPLDGFGKYALYHGDLRLPDNRRAVRFMISVFREIPDFQLMIASGADSEFVKREIEGMPNVSHIRISGKEHLHELLAGAHINVMKSFQESGTKLKLVNALFNSRFCVINANMVDDPSLRALCTMAETKNDFIAAVNRLKTLRYDQSQKRAEVLARVLSDKENALKIRRAILSE